MINGGLIAKGKQPTSTPAPRPITTGHVVYPLFRGVSPHTLLSGSSPLGQLLLAFEQIINHHVIHGNDVVV